MEILNSFVVVFLDLCLRPDQLVSVVSVLLLLALDAHDAHEVVSGVAQLRTPEVYARKVVN